MVVLVALCGAGGLAASVVWQNKAAQNRMYQSIDDLPVRDVALVPGIGARTGRVPLSLYERLAPALALYRAHKVQAVLISGIGTPDRDEVTTSVRWLTDRGVDPADILSDPAGYRTLDTMQRASSVLGVTRVVISTQALFMPRALFLARAAGMDAVGFVAPTLIPMTGDRVRLEALKSAVAFADTRLLGRGPRYTDIHGARLSQTDPGAPVAQPAALSFLTSAISAGMAVSQVATSP